MKNHKKKKK